jgi:hypothetical protein
MFPRSMWITILWDRISQPGEMSKQQPEVVGGMFPTAASAVVFTSYMAMFVAQGLLGYTNNNMESPLKFSLFHDIEIHKSISKLIFLDSSE